MKPVRIPMTFADTGTLVKYAKHGYFLVRRYWEGPVSMTLYFRASAHARQRASAKASGALIASGKFRLK